MKREIIEIEKDTYNLMNTIRKMQRSNGQRPSGDDIILKASLQVLIKSMEPKGL